jgi:hypothetical protein
VKANERLVKGMPRLLELFSGTGSIGRAFREKGWETISLDMNAKSGADIIADITKWDYTCHVPGFFQCVWASPCCTHYSKARTNAKTPRDLIGSDAMVARVLEIIKYHNADYFIENPESGLLKTRDVIKNLPYIDITYCKYGYSYRKKTRVWHNNIKWQPHTPCCAAFPCVVLEGGRHPMTAQRGPGRAGGLLKVDDKCSLNELYSIPPALCKEIAEAATEINRS